MAKDYGKIKIQMGEDLRIIRQKGNYTRVMLAEITEVSRNEIMNIEHGRVMPSIEILDRLCEVLGIKLSEIVKIFEKKEYVIKNDADLKRENQATGLCKTTTKEKYLQNKKVLRGGTGVLY